jgi:hypothetical protein
MYTNELNPVQLNWILAQHLNQTYGQACYDPKTKRSYQNEGWRQIGVNYSPATNWKECGPLIEQYCIELYNAQDGTTQRIAHMQKSQVYSFGEDSLIAACRCLVKYFHGEEVHIPEELV